MARYTGRQLPGSPSTAGGSGGFFSLGKQLADKRGLNRPVTKKIAPVKPSLTTSKEKGAEISKLINKDYQPSGMQLAKLRQLAAQGKILNPKEARDFLHRSEAGKKLETREGLQKFEAELLKAELQATREQVHSPIKYKYREGGESHLDQKAKEMVKGLYKESAAKAQEQAMESSHLNALQERQARLATLHAALRPQAPAQPATQATRSNAMPSLQAVEPLPTSSPSSARTGSPLVAPPTGIGSHVPGAHLPTDVPNVGLGMPSVVSHESTGPTVAEPMPAPVVHEPEPVQLPTLNHEVSEPLPAHPVVPTETAPASFDTDGPQGSQ